mgnify:CR=1 FL=1
MLPDMTWEEVKDRARESDVAIVVTGANEQHGIHLPLKTDIFIATEIAKRGVDLVKNDVKPIIAPPIPFGYSPEHQFFPGTIVINLNTFINLVKDVVRSLIKSGFNKIVIINGHGGNPPALMNVVGEIKQEITGIRPGEKLHETLINSDEIRYAWNIDDMYMLSNPHHKLFHTNDLLDTYDGINKVENLNTYSSDIAEKISKDELKEKIKISNLL